MIELDIQQLNERFWATSLQYPDASGQVVTLTDRQVLVENQPAEEHDETRPFVRWTVNPGPSRQVGISPALFLNKGTAILQVFAPRGGGTGQARDIASALEASFRQWRSADRALRIESMERVRGPDPGLHQLNVKLHYESRRAAHVLAPPVNQDSAGLVFSDAQNSGLLALF